jgi:hypothetical protein
MRAKVCSERSKTVERALEPRKVLEVEELGVDRNAGTDRAVCAFAEWADARIVKWIQFPRGVLLFLMVPGDLESGHFYLLDRPKRTFYELNIEEDGRWGGYRQDEFEALTDSLGLKRLAERPRDLGRFARK